MITAITTFALPNPITLEEARNIFLSTAPKYRGVPGQLPNDDDDDTACGLNKPRASEISQGLASTTRGDVG